MTVDLEPHYPVSECAEYLRCSEDWLRARLRDHTFAGVKLAGRWSMRESQLEAAMESMSTTARTAPQPSPTGLSRRSRFHRRRANVEKLLSTEAPA